MVLDDKATASSLKTLCLALRLLGVLSSLGPKSYSLAKLHEDNKPDSSKSDVSNIEAREDSSVERVHHFVVAIKNAA